MEMTRRRGVIWDARANKIDPVDVFQIRRSGLLLSLSTLIQIFALFIFMNAMGKMRIKPINQAFFIDI